jgi:hypothetical protein
MTHADEAARLAKKIEKDNPAMAGMIYALLAVAGQRAAEPEREWTEVFSDDDMLVDWDTIYLIEDRDGSQREWLFTADGARNGAAYWVAVDDAEDLRSQPEMNDSVKRWRRA